MDEYKKARILNSKVLDSRHTKFLLEFAVERGYITNTCNPKDIKWMESLINHYTIGQDSSADTLNLCQAYLDGYFKHFTLR